MWVMHCNLFFFFFFILNNGKICFFFLIFFFRWIIRQHWFIHLCTTFLVFWNHTVTFCRELFFTKNILSALFKGVNEIWELKCKCPTFSWFYNAFLVFFLELPHCMETGTICYSKYLILCSTDKKKKKGLEDTWIVSKWCQN